MNQIGFSRDEGSSKTAYPDWIIGTASIIASTSTTSSMTGMAASAPHSLIESFSVIVSVLTGLPASYLNLPIIRITRILILQPRYSGLFGYIQRLSLPIIDTNSDRCDCHETEYHPLSVSAGFLTVWMPALLSEASS